MKYNLNPRLTEAFKFIRMLANNWDSYGALAPTEQVIKLTEDTCRFYIEHEQPGVQPLPSGEIEISFGSSGLYLLVGVEPPERDKR